MPWQKGTPNESRQIVTDDEFIQAWRQLKGVTAVAKAVGMTPRAAASRRRSIEGRTGVELLSEDIRAARTNPNVIANRPEYHGRYEVDVSDGVVLVMSDAHYWPDITTTAHRAFVKFCKELTPSVIVANGDVFDGASISRWPRMGWDHRPNVIQELKACQERLTEIEDARKGAKKIWTLGNHDARFELRLAQVAPEYEGVKSFAIKDHFPAWAPAWSCWINDEVVVKHRYKGGIHATRNNTLNAGKTTVTGHLHSLKVTPLDDYNGTRFGVDTGTLAEPFGPQFDGYMEDNPRDWRSGFVVLTFHKSKLLWPELVQVMDENHVQFRGKVIEV